MRFVNFYAILALLSASFLCADNASYVKYGLAPLEDHEMDHLENSVHKVIEVTPNDVGFDRIQEHLEKNNLPFLEIEARKKEFGTLRSTSNDALQKLLEAAHLPSHVDNSKLPSFPPIGDQGSLGSCVAWGSTYYQATHEIGLLHGWNNKTNSDHVLSPKWTYNLINRGNNNGSSPIIAYQLLSANGAPSIIDFPYDNNYTAWDLNSQHWVSAISNRMAPCTLIPGLGGSLPQNLTAIKQALNNGHVLTFASFIDSWIFTKIKPDPERPHSPYTNQYAAYWMNGNKGGHFMTIVGYDDDIWIDVNQNGRVDEGERGAFLIANSWGTGWGNQGFIWISYDAFKERSGVVNGPSLDRIPAGIYLNSCLIAASPKEPNYTPRLIAEFSISQVQRNQINIQTGVSATHENAPYFIMNIPAFAGEGEAVEFNGQISTIPGTATFALDLTDFLPQDPRPTPQRYYLLVKDTEQGYPTTLHSFSLLDLVRQQKINSLIPLPKSYDNETGSLYIDY